MNIGPMLNLYPDSLGGTLDDVVDFLKTEEAEGAFSSCYILPSLYHTDLDRDVCFRRNIGSNKKARD